MLTLLTATGARPEAWALCERWMAAQDYDGPVRWLIVDDGPMPQPITFDREGWTLQVERPAPLWREGQNTQARNLLHGLALCHPRDRIVFIEDDDYYSPDWLSHVDAMLERAELVGECMARYYNLSQRQGRQLNNTRHASLCSTAIRGGALMTMKRACQTNAKFIDMKLWERHPSRHLFTGNRVVGIKGLPGRGGIGMGHRPGFTGTHDADGALLRSWVGHEAGDVLWTCR